MSAIELVVRPLEGPGRQPDCIVPSIDGRALTVLVSEFEESHGYEPAAIAVAAVFDRPAR